MLLGIFDKPALAQLAAFAAFSLVAWLLALFSYVAIVSVHMDRPQAGRLALGISAVTTTFALWFLAMHDSPYTGGVRLEAVLLNHAGGSTVH